MGTLNLDLSNIEAMDDFSPVPPGEYVVTVADSEVTHSKAGNLMATLTYEILGPTHAGRRIWDHYVIKNEVAMKRLKSMAQAAGHRNPNFIRDTEELHGLRCIVRVTVEEQDGYAPKNKITAFKPLEKQAATPPPASPAVSPTPPPQQRQQRKSVPPWETAQA